MTTSIYHFLAKIAMNVDKVQWLILAKHKFNHFHFFTFFKFLNQSVRILKICHIFSNFWSIFDHFCQFLVKKSTLVLFEIRPRHPTTLFLVKKVSWVLFEIGQKDHPTLGVLFIICSNKKVLDPPRPSI